MPNLPTKKGRALAKLQRTYVLLYGSALTLVMFGLFWGGAISPTRNLVYRSAWSLLIFVGVIVLAPVVLRLAFPPPLTKRLSGETTPQRLKRERVGLAVLAVIAGTFGTQILLRGPGATQEWAQWVGWGVTGGMILICSRLLWPYQKQTWKQVRKIIVEGKGEKNLRVRPPRQRKILPLVRAIGRRGGKPETAPGRASADPGQRPG